MKTVGILIGGDPSPPQGDFRDRVTVPWISKKAEMGVWGAGKGPNNVKNHPQACFSIISIAPLNTFRGQRFLPTRRQCADDW